MPPADKNNRCPTSRGRRTQTAAKAKIPMNAARTTAALAPTNNTNSTITPTETTTLTRTETPFSNAAINVMSNVML